MSADILILSYLKCSDLCLSLPGIYIVEDRRSDYGGLHPPIFITSWHWNLSQSPLHAPNGRAFTPVCKGRETEIGTKFKERHKLISQTPSLDAYYFQNYPQPHGSKYTPGKCWMTVNVYFFPYYENQSLTSMTVATLQIWHFQHIIQSWLKDDISVAILKLHSDTQQPYGRTIQETALGILFERTWNYSTSPNSSEHARVYRYLKKIQSKKKKKKTFTWQISEWASILWLWWLHESL